MTQTVLTWIGVGLAGVLLLVMALGPAIVEIDAWWTERARRRARRADQTTTVTPVWPQSSSIASSAR